MKVNTRWAGAAALAALLTGGAAVATAVYAQDGPGHGGRHWMAHGWGRSGELGFGHGHGPGVGFAMRQLDLTEAQRAQIRAIHEARRTELTQIGERVRAARKSLHDAVTAGTFDEAAIRARSVDVAAAEADAAVLRGQIHSEIWSLLTPEQQQKATELRAERAKRMEERRERMLQRRQERQQQ